MAALGGRLGFPRPTAVQPRRVAAFGPEEAVSGPKQGRADGVAEAERQIQPQTAGNGLALTWTLPREQALTPACW